VRACRLALTRLTGGMGAPVHVQGLAGDVACAVGGEEPCGLGDVTRLPRAAVVGGVRQIRPSRASGHHRLTEHPANYGSPLARPGRVNCPLARERAQSPSVVSVTENLELMAALRLAVDPPGGLSVEALCELARDDAASAWDIATAAEHLGVNPHTLRYYERTGLVRVNRDSAGHRS
jgi:MerR family regulatory protein